MTAIDDKFEYLTMAGLAPEDVSLFVSRLGAGKASCRLTLDEFLADEELTTVARLLRLDATKFYFLIAFLYDYTCDVCFNGVEIEEGGHEMMWRLIDRGRQLVAGETPPPIKTDASCRFRIQGREYKVADLDSISILLYWIHCGMIKTAPTNRIWELNWLIDDYDEHKVSRSESVSVAIWCFASLLQQFFRRNPQFSGRAPKGSGISLNKLLLASRLVYRLGLSRNENFLYTDETLKGFMRQYKGRTLPGRGKHYGVVDKGE